MGYPKNMGGGTAYSLFDSFIKLMIPFYVVQILWFITFAQEKVTIIYLLRMLIADSFLPYGWYVKAQLCLYIVWKLIKTFGKDKRALKYAILFVGIMAYLAMQVARGETITSYKTIFSFAAGVIIADSEPRIRQFIGNNYILLMVLLFVISGVLRIIPRGEDAFAIILFNIETITFCLAVFVIILTVKIPGKIGIKLSKGSYEIYLIQGIAQCMFCQMYFARGHLFLVDNLVFQVILTLIAAVVLGFVVHFVCSKITRNIPRLVRF